MLKSLMARWLLALAAVCCAAQANAEVYHVSIDTSALAGQDGYLDFLLLGLSNAAPATVQISNLGGDFAAGSFALGDASATGAQLTLGNGDSWNEYGLWAHLGGTISFDASIASISGSGAGSTLSITLLDAGLNYIGLNGDYVTFELQAGSAPLVSASGYASVGASPVPEPAVYLMFMAGLLLLGRQARRRL